MTAPDLTVLVIGLAARPAVTSFCAGKLGVPTRRFFFLGAAPAGRRIAAILAGVVGAWLFAWLLAFAFLAFHAEPIGPLVIDDVRAGAPADGRLRAGDEIVDVDGRPVANIEQLRALAGEAGEQPLRFGVNRNGRRETVDVVPVDGRLGIVAQPVRRRPGAGTAAFAAISGSISAGWLTLKELASPSSRTMMGPVAIYKGPGPDRWMILDRALAEWAVLGSLTFLLLLPVDAIRVLWSLVRPGGN